MYLRTGSEESLSSEGEEASPSGLQPEDRAKELPSGLKLVEAPKDSKSGLAVEDGVMIPGSGLRGLKGISKKFRSGEGIVNLNPFSVFEY